MTDLMDRSCVCSPNDYWTKMRIYDYDIWLFPYLGFTGDMCETETTECVEDICGAGTCVVENGEQVCQCPIG